MQRAIRSTSISALSAVLFLSWIGEATAVVIRQAECAHWGVGHITTYDQKRYDNYTPGFWQMTDHQLSGQARFRVDIRKFENGRVSPANGMAARCGEYVLRTTADDGLVVTLDGMPIEDGSDFHFGPDNGYQLRHWDGNKAILDCHDPQNPDIRSHVRAFYVDGYGGLLNIFTHTSHYNLDGETTGMCGPYNRDQSDDYISHQHTQENYALEESASLFAPQIGGTPVYAEPRQLEFDGQTSHLKDEEITLAPSFYVRAHVRVDASAQWNHLVEIGTLEHEWNAPLRVEVGEEGEWYVAVGDGQGYASLYKRGAWTYGEWVLLEIEYKDGAIRLWENGEDLGVEQADVEVDAVGGQLNIGNFARGGRYFQGALRNLHIRALE